MPRCYIRIDVAHFIKKYADLLATVRQEVKRFFLASLANLVRCQSTEEARTIVYALLTISLSRNDGLNSEGVPSACEREKNVMDGLLTGETSVEYELRESSSNIEDEENEEIASTQWCQWAFDLKSSAEKAIGAVKGKGVNAHLCIEFAERLMVDLAWLPLWSCVVRNKFGYGRIPASSAHVESEFGKIKNLLLKDETTPMRVDQFVKKHVNHISGVTKIVDAAIIEEETQLHSNHEYSSSDSDKDNNSSTSSKNENYASMVSIHK